MLMTGSSGSGIRIRSRKSHGSGPSTLHTYVLIQDAANTCTSSCKLLFWGKEGLEFQKRYKGGVQRGAEGYRGTKLYVEVACRCRID